MSQERPRDLAHTQTAFASYQDEIYLNGLLTGEPPRFPTGAAAVEAAARERMTAEAYGYVAGGAGGEATIRANRAAFERRTIVPRMLRDVGVRDLSCSLLGTDLPAPVLLAPVGVLAIAHPDAEPAVARAAAGLGLPMVLSTASSVPLEEAAEASGDGPRWFQLYWPKDREVTLSLLRRARAAGYTTLVLTLDTWLLGWRPRDLDRAYLPFLQRIGIANYLSDPAFLAGLTTPPEEDPLAAVAHWAGMFADPTKTWEDLAFLRAHWDGPIVLKGVQHPDDARRARDAGMDGVVVSNHGGRQVDGAAGSLDVLPSVAGAVGDDLAVLFDSGVRGGADILKALALGARAVLVGRPYVYGLALGGEEGVRHVLRCLLAELDLSLALTGHARLAELGPGVLGTD
ncbi:alpha-hydroxy-acid oxidizing protein [Streptomyces sp. S07_1.15]|uniref:alpha-hydroxy-acid oxidizing protein n=1 Tax=Streptomyces sp. S07_1.15 TaxID=2873925 RepID=UPI001D14FA71|nr:alpha-hydroxy-acid oxidizing protein [Streptomyces sp. S07_1.15]MCC3655573.1 alpha-hydroxy-acid oxidizing protein [Streptomyces sp. S07_1.15]